MDAGAADFFAGYGQAPAARLYPVAHTCQAVAVGRNLANIKTVAVVMDFNRDVAFHVLQADDDLSRLVIFTNIGQRLLHQAGHRQLRHATQLDLFKVGRDG